jgi:hypothetical protein
LPCQNNKATFNKKFVGLTIFAGANDPKRLCMIIHSVLFRSTILISSGVRP